MRLQVVNNLVDLNRFNFVVTWFDENRRASTFDHTLLLITNLGLFLHLLLSVRIHRRSYHLFTICHILSTSVIVWCVVSCTSTLSVFYLEVIFAVYSFLLWSLQRTLTQLLQLFKVSLSLWFHMPRQSIRQFVIYDCMIRFLLAFLIFRSNHPAFFLRKLFQWKTQFLHMQSIWKWRSFFSSFEFEHTWFFHRFKKMI